MLEVIIGLISGIVTGTGMGGGTVLILLLTLWLGLEQHIAQGTNLIFFIPTSIAAIYMNLKEKNVDIKIGLNLAIYGVIGAVIGAFLARKTGAGNLRRYFGIFILLIAIYEIYSLIKKYIFHKKRNNNIIKTK